MKTYIVYILFFTCGFTAFAKPIQTQKIIVSGPSPYVVKTVKEIYNKGGNIFDAAIAAAFTLSVTHPYYVSLACGGFALLKNKKGIKALDFREIAPSKTSANFYTKNKLSSKRSGSAVGVPGFVAGQWAIYKKYGSLPWSVLLKPAIQLADKGFMVSGQWWEKTHNKKKEFNLAGQKLFFRLNGKPYLPNEILYQKKLAKALKLISKKKDTFFYNSVLGKDIVKTVRQNKGVMSLKDLKNYKVYWLKPISFKLGDYTVFSMPLPSSGGIILNRASQLITNTQINKMSIYSLKEWHILGEILSFAFRPRNQMGDLSASVLKPYLKNWTSVKKIKKLSSQISLKKVTHLPVLSNTISVKSSGETTHISLMNNKGDAVSMTLTLNGNFGSLVVTKKYGIVLNNQMDDFNTHPNKPNQFGLIQGVNNNVIKGHRPLSSMSPTIITKNKKVVMVLGASGGPMIISSVLQVMYRYLIQKLDLDSAVQAPRVHHQFLPRVLFVEKNRFSPLMLTLLKNKKHTIKIYNSIAKVYAVSKNKNGFLQGSYDARGEGATGGF